MYCVGTYIFLYTYTDSHIHNAAPVLGRNKKKSFQKILFINQKHKTLSNNTACIYAVYMMYTDVHIYLESLLFILDYTIYTERKIYT